MLIREMGEEKAEANDQKASEQVIYKIDIPANRCHTQCFTWALYVYMRLKLIC